jgi:hypothetical protein
MDLGLRWLFVYIVWIVCFNYIEEVCHHEMVKWLCVMMHNYDEVQYLA